MKYRVGTFGAVLLTATALILDGLQFILTFIPVIGQAISIFISMLAAAFFGVFFFVFFRVNYFEGNKALAKIGTIITTTVVEFVPLVQALPAITLGVLSIIIFSRMEDRVNEKKRARDLKKQQQTALARPTRHERQEERVSEDA